MFTPHYAAGSTFLALCALLLWRGHRQVAASVSHPGSGLAFSGPAGEWFARMKPYCNAVEVETHQAALPAPGGTQGAGYSAACYALAGKIDRARELLLGLRGDDRWRGAGIVFEVGHPVADAGDDRSAGPIMELVLEYWPNNYMALYHAGMSEYSLGQPELSRTHLRSFLDLYHENDGWRRNALEVLGRLGGE